MELTTGCQGIYIRFLKFKLRLRCHLCVLPFFHTIPIRHNESSTIFARFLFLHSHMLEKRKDVSVSAIHQAEAGTHLSGKSRIFYFKLSSRRRNPICKGGNRNLHSSILPEILSPFFKTCIVTSLLPISQH